MDIGVSVCIFRIMLRKGASQPPPPPQGSPAESTTGYESDSNSGDESDSNSYMSDSRMSGHQKTDSDSESEPVIS